MTKKCIKHLNVQVKKTCLSSLQYASQPLPWSSNLLTLCLSCKVGTDKALHLPISPSPASFVVVSVSLWQISQPTYAQALPTNEHAKWDPPTPAAIEEVNKEFIAWRRYMVGRFLPQINNAFNVVKNAVGRALNIRHQDYDVILSKDHKILIKLRNKIDGERT